MFATYLNVKIEVVMNTITVLTVGTTVQLTVTFPVRLLRSSVIDTELESLALGVVGAQLFTFVQGGAAMTDDVVRVDASRGNVPPADSVVLSRHS